MLLGFTHKKNKMAPGLVSYLETKGPIVSYKEMHIEEAVYFNVLIMCGNSDSKYIINNPQAVQNSWNLKHVAQILDINGILYKNSFDERISKTYRILVFDRSTISIKQRTYGKTTSQTKYLEESQCKKMAELAERVIYVLGLDYGMVKIAVTRSKRIQVVSVDDSPAINEKARSGLFSRFDNLIKTINNRKIKGVKMGADPEFMLSNTRTGKMIPASQFFPRDGIVGCDAIRTPNRQQRPIAELRPRPAYSPLQLLSNLEDALRSANKMAPYRNVKWLAGSRPFNGYSIGGHIHFSNVALNNHILRALDTYVTLPLFLIENQATAVKRRLKYGFLADYRVKEYGGFEYRTPASWLVSPEITTAVLCLGKIVASNYLQLNRNCFLSLEAQQAFYEGDQAYLKVVFNAVWSDIQRLEMCNSFKQELEIISHMVKNDIQWEEKEDIRKTWSISPPPGKKKVITVPGDNTVPFHLTNNRLRNTNPGRSIATNNNNRDHRSGGYNNAHTSGPVFISTRNYFN
ncbi:MAG: hypothetical protein WC147_00605 [Syntrophomonas sp.]